MAGHGGRISAVVEMNHPGVWVMGDLADDDRHNGMGIVVEYAGYGGKAQWIPPKPFKWNYAYLGRVLALHRSRTRHSSLLFEKKMPPRMASISGPSMASAIPIRR